MASFWEDLDVDMSRWFIRLAEILLGFLTFVLASATVGFINGLTGATNVGVANAGFTIFVALVATLLAVLFAFGPILHNRHGIRGIRHLVTPQVELGITVVMVIFWLAAFIATAVEFFGIKSVSLCNLYRLIL